MNLRSLKSQVRDNVDYAIPAEIPALIAGSINLESWDRVIIQMNDQLIIPIINQLNNHES